MGDLLALTLLLSTLLLFVITFVFNISETFQKPIVSWLLRQQLAIITVNLFCLTELKNKLK